MAAQFNFHWGWLAALGLGLAVLVSGDVAWPDRWALARQLHPAAQGGFLALLNAIEQAGWKVVLTSSKRPGTGDYHGFGLALDLNIVNLKTGQWLRSTDSKATWEASGVPSIIRRMGFRWGGDFVTPWAYNGVTHAAYDPVHVDAGKYYPIAALRAKALALAGSAAALASFDTRKISLVTLRPVNIA